MNVMETLEHAAGLVNEIEITAGRLETAMGAARDLIDSIMYAKPDDPQAMLVSTTIEGWQQLMARSFNEAEQAAADLSQVMDAIK